MNTAKALERYSEMRLKYPELVLTGSLSLIISGAIKPREIHDLDFTFTGLGFVPFEGLTKIHSRYNNATEVDTYEGHFDDGTTFNVFVPAEDVITPVMVINKVIMVAPYIALEWKAKMDRPKDKQDGYSGQF